MKRTHSASAVLLLVIGGLFGNANESRAAASIYATSLADGGRLVIRHSPVLGLNVGLAVRIDGQDAGAFTKGHTYEKFLTPGRHVVTVVPRGREQGASRTTLDVRAGATYSYSAKYQGDKLALVPAGGSR